MPGQRLDFLSTPPALDPSVPLVRYLPILKTMSRHIHQLQQQSYDLFLAYNPHLSTRNLTTITTSAPAASTPSVRMPKRAEELLDSSMILALRFCKVTLVLLPALPSFHRCFHRPMMRLFETEASIFLDLIKRYNDCGASGYWQQHIILTPAATTTNATTTTSRSTADESRNYRYGAESVMVAQHQGQYRHRGPDIAHHVASSAILQTRSNDGAGLGVVNLHDADLDITLSQPRTRSRLNGAQSHRTSPSLGEVYRTGRCFTAATVAASATVPGLPIRPSSPSQAQPTASRNDLSHLRRGVSVGSVPQSATSEAGFSTRASLTGIAVLPISQARSMLPASPSTFRSRSTSALQTERAAAHWANPMAFASSASTRSSMEAGNAHATIPYPPSPLIQTTLSDPFTRAQMINEKEHQVLNLPLPRSFSATAPSPIRSNSASSHALPILSTTIPPIIITAATPTASAASSGLAASTSSVTVSSVEGAASPSMRAPLVLNTISASSFSAITSKSKSRCDSNINNHIRDRGSLRVSRRSSVLDLIQQYNKTLRKPIVESEHNPEPEQTENEALKQRGGGGGPCVTLSGQDLAQNATHHIMPSLRSQVFTASAASVSGSSRSTHQRAAFVPASATAAIGPSGAPAMNRQCSSLSACSAATSSSLTSAAVSNSRGAEVGCPATITSGSIGISVKSNNKAAADLQSLVFKEKMKYSTRSQGLPNEQRHGSTVATSPSSATLTVQNAEEQRIAEIVEARTNSTMLKIFGRDSILDLDRPSTSTSRGTIITNTSTSASNINNMTIPNSSGSSTWRDPHSRPSVAKVLSTEPLSKISNFIQANFTKEYREEEEYLATKAASDARATRGFERRTRQKSIRRNTSSTSTKSTTSTTSTIGAGVGLGYGQNRVKSIVNQWNEQALAPSSGSLPISPAPIPTRSLESRIVTKKASTMSKTTLKNSATAAGPLSSSSLLESSSALAITTAAATNNLRPSLVSTYSTDIGSSQHHHRHLSAFSGKSSFNDHLYSSSASSALDVSARQTFTRGAGNVRSGTQMPHWQNDTPSAPSLRPWKSSIALNGTFSEAGSSKNGSINSVSTRPPKLNSRKIPSHTENNTDDQRGDNGSEYHDDDNDEVVELVRVPTQSSAWSSRLYPRVSTSAALKTTELPRPSSLQKSLYTKSENDYTDNDDHDEEQLQYLDVEPCYDSQGWLQKSRANDEEEDNEDEEGDDCQDREQQPQLSSSSLTRREGNRTGPRELERNTHCHSSNSSSTQSRQIYPHRPAYASLLAWEAEAVVARSSSSSSSKEPRLSLRNGTLADTMRPFSPEYKRFLHGRIEREEDTIDTMMNAQAAPFSPTSTTSTSSVQQSRTSFGGRSPVSGITPSVRTVRRMFSRESVVLGTSVAPIPATNTSPLTVQNAAALVHDRRRSLRKSHQQQ